MTASTSTTAQAIATAEALLISSTADMNRWARIAATRDLTPREARMQRNAQDQAILDRSRLEALKEAQATQARQALKARATFHAYQGGDQPNDLCDVCQACEPHQAHRFPCGHRPADLLGECTGAGCQVNCPEACNHQGVCASERDAIQRMEALAEGAWLRAAEAGYPGYDYDPNDAYAQDR